MRCRSLCEEPPRRRERSAAIAHGIEPAATESEDTLDTDGRAAAHDGGRHSPRVQATNVEAACALCRHHDVDGALAAARDRQQAHLYMRCDRIGIEYV